MINKALSLAVFIFLLFSTQPVKADGDVSSSDLYSSSYSFSCLKWRVTGMCFWLDCKLFYCSIETSLKVKHYVPDVFVQVYQNYKHRPWEEASFNFMKGQSGSLPEWFKLEPNKAEARIGGGKDPRVINKHIEIVGNPGSYGITKLAESFGAGCEGSTTPYFPYYLSEVDYFSWRWPFVEMLELDTWILFKREVGLRGDGKNTNFLFTHRWGSVFPRIGSLNSNDDYQASAVFAARAANIVTSGDKTHVYKSINASSKSGYWPAGEIHEAKSSTGKWQMVYPKEENKCHIFGETSISDLATKAKEVAKDAYGAKRSRDGTYLWNLWRPYECCEDKGSWLFDIGI